MQLYLAATSSYSIYCKSEYCFSLCLFFTAADKILWGDKVDWLRIINTIKEFDKPPERLPKELPFLCKKHIEEKRPKTHSFGTNHIQSTDLYIMVDWRK